MKNWYDPPQCTSPAELTREAGPEPILPAPGWIENSLICVAHAVLFATALSLIWWVSA